MIQDKRIQAIALVATILIGVLFYAGGYLVAIGQISIPADRVPTGVDLHLLGMGTGIIFILGGVGLIFIGIVIAMSMVSGITQKQRKFLEFIVTVVPGVITAGVIFSILFNIWPSIPVLITVGIIAYPVWRLLDENYISADPSKPA